MVHWASNYRTVGRYCTISTNVTESRMKTAVKTKAKKNNNQASVGGSILKANMEMEAAVELAHDFKRELLCRLCTQGRKCAESLHAKFLKTCRLFKSLQSALTADF